jgi:hypothetical protein
VFSAAAVVVVVVVVVVGGGGGGGGVVVVACRVNTVNTVNTVNKVVSVCLAKNVSFPKRKNFDNQLFRNVLCQSTYVLMDRVNVLGITTRYGLNVPGIESR